MTAGGSSTTPSSSFGPDRASLSTAETCTSAVWIKRKMWGSISAWRQTPLAPLSAGRRASTSRVSAQLLYFFSSKIHQLYLTNKQLRAEDWHPDTRLHINIGVCKPLPVFHNRRPILRVAKHSLIFGLLPSINDHLPQIDLFLVTVLPVAGHVPYYSSIHAHRYVFFFVFFFFCMLPLVFHKCIYRRLRSRSHCW